MNRTTSLRNIFAGLAKGWVLQTLLGSCWLIGLFSMVACNKTEPTRESKPYRLLEFKDPGNHMRNYTVLRNHMMNITTYNSRNLTPEQLQRNRALSDSLYLSRTPEAKDQLARLMGFNNALHRDTLTHQLHLERQAVLKTNPSFLTKSWRDTNKWLLLSQAGSKTSTASTK